MRFIDSCYWIQGHFWFSCPCCSPLLVLLLSTISFQLNIYLWPQALMCLKFSPVGRTTYLCSSKSHCLPAALIDSHAHLWTRYQNQKIWQSHFCDSLYLPLELGSFWNNGNRMWGRGDSPKDFINVRKFCHKNNFLLNKMLLFSSLWREYFMV